ncbi:hypothetical protein CAPN004_23770 [Capnocytophaga cynodegmi]|uniref:hypothetical protein n=1 Tax=Capnocytophaga cynodegmi TaxID=28189 RepID=UPI001AD5FFF0|nr:hypothetical protein [Capnocytophaga cynodegmi]GIM53348.1 hypothetical protein CAPN004_23770 [Capnocytophaga cynodegmi]
MTELEKNTILDFASSDISVEKFYEILPQYINEDFVIDEYEKAITEKDSEILSYLRMIPISNIKSLEKIYQKLLLENWHIESEDVVSFFQYVFNENKNNITFLLKSLENIPEYLKIDTITKQSYIKKIIYVIGAQPQPESLLALEKLAQETNDKKIKELALHQLEKRKRLGRWEAEMNSSK